MEKKLTLKMDQDVISKAKLYAEQKKTSLSKMVELYFRTITESEINQNQNYSLLVKELSGIIKLDNETDYKDDYTKYLIKKYD